jgi:hypothetical protein
MGALERSEIVCATSSTLPIRPAGISSHISRISSFEKQAFIGVSIIPQASAFTEMLLGASSLASAFVNRLMPPLAAE